MHSPQASERIALIAGTGTLPLTALQHLQNRGRSFFILSLFPEDNGDLLRQAVTDPTVQFVAQPFYKVGEIRKLLRDRQATHVLMVGKVDKRKLLARLSLDWELISLTAALATKGDASLMEHVITLLAQEGLTVLSQATILEELFAQPGILCGALTKEIDADIKLGLETANHLSALDIGQTVVCKNGMILAVEAIEGTDECIARSISLGKEGVVITKTCHPRQDGRYDIPTLGPATLAALPVGAVRAIAWHAQRTFILDQRRFIAIAQEKNIALIALPSDALQSRPKPSDSRQE